MFNQINRAIIHQSGTSGEATSTPSRLNKPPRRSHFKNALTLCAAALLLGTLPTQAAAPHVDPVPAVWNTVVDRPTEAYQLTITDPDTALLDLEVIRESSNEALV